MASLQTIKKRRSGVPAHVALDRMAAIPREARSSLQVLDIPAGHGVVTLPISLAGFRAVGCDLFPETAQDVLAKLTPASLPATLRRYWSDARAPKLVQELLASPPSEPLQLPAMVQGDMTRPLPFADGTFDTVLTLEGIEHIDALDGYLHELRRVMKLGGRLIVSTPNILCLRARLAYCVTGQRTLSTFIDEHTAVQAQDGGRLYHGHVFLVDYFELRYLLHRNGFRIRAPLRSRWSWSSLLLSPFLLPMVAAAALLAPRKAKRKFRRLRESGEVPADVPEPYREIRRHVLSPALLFGKNLILDAEAV